MYIKTGRKNDSRKCSKSQFYSIKHLCFTMVENVRGLPPISHFSWRFCISSFLSEFAPSFPIFFALDPSASSLRSAWIHQNLCMFPVLFRCFSEYFPTPIMDFRFSEILSFPIWTCGQSGFTVPRNYIFMFGLCIPGPISLSKFEIIPLLKLERIFYLLLEGFHLLQAI